MSHLLTQSARIRCASCPRVLLFTAGVPVAQNRSSPLLVESVLRAARVEPGCPQTGPNQSPCLQVVDVLAGLDQVLRLGGEATVTEAVRVLSNGVPSRVFSFDRDDATLTRRGSGNTWARFTLLGPDGAPMANRDVVVHLPDGTTRTARSGTDGVIALEGLPLGAVLRITEEPDAPPPTDSRHGTGPACAPTNEQPNDELKFSVNGWPAHTRGEVVNATTIHVPVASGGTASAVVRAEVAPRFEALVAWFDTAIEPVKSVYGHNYRPIRGYGWSSISNHGSGTAIDINAAAHPLSTVTFSAGQHSLLVSKASELGLRWGGTYSHRKDEMHFEVNTPPPPEAISLSRSRLSGGSAQT